MSRELDATPDALERLDRVLPRELQISAEPVGWAIPGRVPIHLSRLVPDHRVVDNVVRPILFVRVAGRILVHPSRWDRYLFVYCATEEGW